MTAFRQVITRLQAGEREEAMIALEFVLRLDRSFAPASRLQELLASGATEIDPADIIAQLQAASVEDVDGTLVEAVDDFNNRNFLDARKKVNRVLLDLPGHPEARQMLGQIEEALSRETQIGQLLTEAREALDNGRLEKASELMLSAQVLDPHHPGVESTLHELQSSGGQADAPGSEPAPPTPPEAAPTEPPQVVGFEIDHAEAAAALFEEPDQAQGFDPWATDPADELTFSDDTAGREGDTSSPLPEFETGTADTPLFEPESIGDTAGHLFQQVEEPPEVGPAAGADVGDPGPSQEIEDLLAQGQAAFDTGDAQTAIDLWSRVYLVDPANERVAPLIDQARQRLGDTERQVGLTLGEAHEAEGAGDIARSLELVEQVLQEQPNHIEAVALKERLTEGTVGAEAPATTAVVPPELPDLDEHLFEEEGDEVAELTEAAPAEVADDSWVPERTPAKGKKAPAAVAKRVVPWPMMAAAGGAIVVILIGAWFGSQFLSARSGDQNLEALARVFEESEDLYESGRIEEAVHLLRQFPATSELDQQRIDRRIERYQAALAPPTPTPVPVSVGTAETLLEQGLWIAAYAEVDRGLEAHPGDAGLQALKARVLQLEPQLASLHRASSSDDYATTVMIAKDLVERHPGQSELVAQLQRSLFNAALVELRSYNLTGAEGYLAELDQLAPGDEEVARVLIFVAKYKTRPVDMQLQIFIRSLSFR